MRKTLLLLVLLVAVVAGTALLASRKASHWTTGSEAALAEFQLGLEADQKLYGNDALGHFQRALELDPDFAAAKLFVARQLEGPGAREHRRALTEELRSVDLATVSDRERFLIERQIAFADDDVERADALLKQYLEENPKDPFALDRWCQKLWRGSRTTEAADCFRRLIQVDPNWVRAQNLLGYLAMAKGDWQNAEEQFEIYRYMAPDQANPHDSLGELLVITGRWDQARREFEEALAVKPDFCLSWDHLVRLELLRDDFAEVDRVLHRAHETGPCGEGLEARMRCRVEVWRAYSAGNLEGTWETFQSPICEGQYHDASLFAYKAALAIGRNEEAAELYDTIAGLVKHSDNPEEEAGLFLFDGVRLRAEGRPSEAADKFAQADQRFGYRDSVVGTFKLATRLEQLEALREAGRTAEAESLLAELRETNAEMVDRWLDGPASQRVASDSPPADPPTD